MSSTPIAPAYQSITEDDVLRCLRDADIRQLARALDPGAFKGDNGPDNFRCPSCKAPTAAQALDSFRWACTWCGPNDTTVSDQWTRLALRRMVGDSYEASLRLVHDVAGPGVRQVPGVRE